MPKLLCWCTFRGPTLITQIVATPAFIAVVLLIPLLLTQALAAPTTKAGDCNSPAPQPITSLGLPGHPFGIVTTKDGCWLFVSITDSPRGHGIAVLWRTGGAVRLQRMIPLKASPHGMVMTHDERLLVVAARDYVAFLDMTRMIEAGGDPVLGYLAYGHNPGIFYVSVTPDDKLLVVSNENRGTITVIDLVKARSTGFKGDAIIAHILAGEGPKALAFSADGRWLYATVQIASPEWNWPIECKLEGQDLPTLEPQTPAGAVVAIDVAKVRREPLNAIVAKVPSGCSPVRLALSPDGATIWVTARNGNAVLAFDATELLHDGKNARLAAAPVGIAPVGVIVTSDGARVIVANSNQFGPAAHTAQTLSVIDALNVRSGKANVVGTVSAASFPRELAQSPDGQTLFVANYSSNTLEVIDLARLPRILSQR